MVFFGFSWSRRPLFSLRRRSLHGLQEIAKLSTAYKVVCRRMQRELANAGRFRPHQHWHAAGVDAAGQVDIRIADKPDVGSACDAAGGQCHINRRRIGLVAFGIKGPDDAPEVLRPI